MITGLTGLYVWVLIIFGSIYLFFIFRYTIGWYSLPTFNSAWVQSQNLFVSIIIPVRNEASNILDLLGDLMAQQVANSCFEVIVADDESTDNTAALVEQFRKDHPEFQLQLLRMDSEPLTTAFKKKAITIAIQKAKGELIITTDGDCRMGRNWLSSLLACYEKFKPSMIIGPVAFHHEKSWFDKFQSLEFLSLIGITAGAIQIRKPIMGNGANLLYEKKAFIDLGGFGKDGFASGDDVFLIMRFKKKFGGNSVRFLKSRDAIVFTEPRKSFSEFFQQRTRWASKNRGYSLNILIVSATVFIVNALILTSWFLGIFQVKFLILGIMATLIKFLVDFPLSIGIFTFASKNKYLFYLIPLVILYPAYIVLVGTTGVLAGYRWKGRKIRK